MKYMLMLILFLSTLSYMSEAQASGCYGCSCKTECWRTGICHTVCRDSCGQFCYAGQELGPERSLERSLEPNFTSLAGPITITIRDPVVFNQHTLRYHKESCRDAQRCTRNCALQERAQAIREGGVPCKHCGG